MDTRAFDVVVVGGGPGGSICAARLAQSGVSTLVLEKERFPRFHLGESLLPQSMPILAEIGALESVRSTFLPKYGARFHDDKNRRKDRFGFDGAWKPDPDHAFQVPRDAFDALLLDRARESGADVRECWTVSRMAEDGGGMTVDARSPEGESVQFRARYVVDASGRDALTAHAGGTTQKIEGLDQTALFAHYEGVSRAEGNLAGDIDIVLFPDPTGTRPNWFWVIPFKDGRTSVGAVVSRAWIRTRKSELAGVDDVQTALLQAAIAESKTATEMLAPAKMLWPSARATADFSYRVRSLSGAAWLAVGDAGGFIDPLFSTGAHLAIVGAKGAADVVLEALATPARWDESRAAWEARLRSGAETFILAVQAFYAGPLVDLIFTQDKHAVLRRSITSLLAGDVFHDALWLRDARKRLVQFLGSPSDGPTLSA